MSDGERTCVSYGACNLAGTGIACDKRCTGYEMKDYIRAEAIAALERVRRELSARGYENVDGRWMFLEKDVMNIINREIALLSGEKED